MDVSFDMSDTIDRLTDFREAKLQLHNENLIAENKQLRQDILQLRGDCETLRQETEKLWQEIEHLRLVITDRDQTLKATTSTLSFKLSRPLRGLEKLFSSPKHRSIH